MKLALLADLHANLQALEACLADARAQGATQFAFLGDLVGYGAHPAEVVDLVMRMLRRDGAWALRGNHDEAAVRPLPGSPRVDQVGAADSRARLSPAHLEFLGQLPLVVQLGPVLLVHASADDPPAWTYVQHAPQAAASLDAARAAGATHVFAGHVHEQRLFYQGAGRSVMAFEPTPGVAIPVPRHRQWFATVGSVGQPRDRHPDAMYALLDQAAWQLTFRRVPYDHAAAARAILAAGLPEWNARRLALGQ